jgi:hypothetical protein
MYKSFDIPSLLLLLSVVSGYTHSADNIKRKPTIVYNKGEMKCGETF